MTIPCEHLHSDFQKLQKQQAKMMATESLAPLVTAGPRAEEETKGSMFLILYIIIIAIYRTVTMCMQTIRHKIV